MAAFLLGQLEAASPVSATFQSAMRLHLSRSTPVRSLLKEAAFGDRVGDSDCVMDWLWRWCDVRFRP